MFTPCSIRDGTFISHVNHGSPGAFPASAMCDLLQHNVRVPVHAYVHASSLSLSPSRFAVTINHNSASFLFASAEKSLDGLEGSFEEADGTKEVVFFRGKSFRLSTRYGATNEEIHDETPNYE